MSVRVPVTNIPSILGSLRILKEEWSVKRTVFNPYNNYQKKVQAMVLGWLTQLERRLNDVFRTSGAFLVPEIMKTFLHFGTEMSFFTEKIYSSICEPACLRADYREYFQIWLGEFVTSDKHLVMKVTSGSNTGSAPRKPAGSDELQKLRDRVAVLEQVKADQESVIRDWQDTAAFLDQESQKACNERDALQVERDALRAEVTRLRASGANSSRASGANSSRASGANSSRASGANSSRASGANFKLGTEEPPASSSGHAHYAAILKWTKAARPLVTAYRSRDKTRSTNMQHIKSKIEARQEVNSDLPTYLRRVMMTLHSDKVAWKSDFPRAVDFIKELSQLVTGLRTNTLTAEFKELDKNVVITL